MNFIKHFNQISKSDAAIAGGKGASLGEMTQAEIPVPPGFVVLSSAFEKFLEETDLNVEIDSILHSVNLKEMRTIENASEKIKDLILKASMPKDISEEIKKEFKSLKSKFVAVRSSATAEDSSSAAWAGQLDSFLNTTEETLLENVQKCWASLFTPRAIFYRFEKGLHNSKISVAVVVQKMIESESSGIAFSVHPVTEDRNQLIIEAGYGLGEAIVSGQITPDSYVVEKNPRRIIDKNISAQERGIYRKQKSGGNEWQNIPKEKGQKQKLTDEQILELSELIIQIENHYDFPCDIEWAYEKSKFYITQSRPITTLGEKVNKEKEIIFDKFISRAYSMLQIEAYNGFLTEVSKEIGHPATYPIFVYDFTQELVHLYYNMNELKPFIGKVGEKISNEDGFRKNIFSKSMEVFESIKKYFDGELSVKTIEELISFWKLFKDYMKYVSYVWVLPRLDFVPQKIKDEAMDIRKKTEYYAGRRDSIMNEFVASMINNRMVNPSFLSLEEIKNNGDFERITKERSKGFLFYRGEIVSGGKISDFLRSKNFILRDPEITDSSKIKGEIAQKGFVKGIARIVYTEKDLKKISSLNDILVSPMTRPEFVPAMKIAGAVVTDEGGIVCHAAIVAREMKKPCIIGTKIATKVLHDGDLVEVDADKGVVRILERAK